MNKINKKLAKIAKVIPSKHILADAHKSLTRAFGSDDYTIADPFVLLDEGQIKFPGGFADHPHRGFQAVAYVKKGTMQHEDFLGHKRPNNEGDVSWIVAGKGIVHAEMAAPQTQEGRVFQLWINLPAKEKFNEPQYYQFPSKTIPVFRQEGLTAKIISGSLFGICGPAQNVTPVEYFDFSLKINSVFSQELKENWNGLLYLYEGKAKVNDQIIKSGTSVFFEKNAQTSEARIESLADETQFLWLAGLPIGEPMIQKGPFVVSSAEEGDQAYADFQAMQNGFEHLKGWSSEIKKTIESFKQTKESK